MLYGLGQLRKYDDYLKQVLTKCGRELDVSRIPRLIDLALESPLHG